MDNTKLLHHIGAGLGFVGLLVWYLIAAELGIVNWITLQAPESHSGAGFMIAIMIVMTPGLFLWKLYNRWLERRLNISGRYYEDDFYRTEKKDEPDSH